MDLKVLLGALMPHKEDRERRAMMEGRSLVIDCAGCEDTPDPSSEKCMGCAVRCMSGTPRADSVILRNGNDVEISGSSGSAIGEAASLMRWTLLEPPSDRRCAGCKLSPDKVTARAWEDFPKDSVGFARDMLDWDCPGGGDCDSCRERSRRCLDTIEEGIRRIVDGMVSP